MRWRTTIRHLATCALVALGSTQADALKFNFIDAGGAAQGTEARRLFEIAGKYWGSVIKNDVSLNFRIGLQDFGTSPILGGSYAINPTVFIDDYYKALKKSAKSQIDAGIVANLKPLTPGAGETAGHGTVAGWVPDYLDPVKKTGYTADFSRYDNDKSINNAVVAAPVALLRGMGFTQDRLGYSLDNYLDGKIEFSIPKPTLGLDNIDYDFDPTTFELGDSRRYDFLSIAIHEIGHSLGFTSGADSYDYIAWPNGPLRKDYRETNAETDPTGILAPMDMFRYGSDADKKGDLDWRPGSFAYLSDDGGKTPLLGLGYLSTGSYNGDGFQGSHWNIKRSGKNIMRPAIDSGLQYEVNALDLAFYDAVGWDIAIDVKANPGYSMGTADIYRQFAVGALATPKPVSAAVGSVPEPVTWVQMLLGFGLLGASLRRRRSVAVAA